MESRAIYSILDIICNQIFQNPITQNTYTHTNMRQIESHNRTSVDAWNSRAQWKWFCSAVAFACADQNYMADIHIYVDIYMECGKKRRLQWNRCAFCKSSSFSPVWLGVSMNMFSGMHSRFELFEVDMEICMTIWWSSRDRWCGYAAVLSKIYTYKYLYSIDVCNRQ